MMRLPHFTFHAPREIREAADLLAAAAPGAAMLVAGGTDLLPNMKRRQQVPSSRQTSCPLRPGTSPWSGAEMFNTHSTEAVARDRAQRREAQASVDRIVRAAKARSGSRWPRPARSTHAG